MLASLAILIVSGTLLPDPYEELGLDDKQAKRIKGIVDRYDRQIIAIKDRARKTPEKAKEAIAAVMERREEEIVKLLTDAQKKKLAEIRKLEMEGVPIGGGFFRSYHFKDFYLPRSGGSTSIQGLGESIQAAALRPRDGIKFDITNKSGRDVDIARFSVELIDGDGKRVGQKTIELEELADGQTSSVKIASNVKFERIEVKLSE